MSSRTATSSIENGTSPTVQRDPSERILVRDTVPFILVHVVALSVFWIGVTPTQLAVCVGLYVLRMWGVTAGYHRYFSHRAYKTSRWFQFVLALVATSSTQKGVLWWAANHRHHHRYSDEPEDIHSPKQSGFWWSHVGWILSRKYDETRLDLIKDFAKYPELRWLNRFQIVPPVLLALSLYLVGGFGLMVWGYFVSTVFLFHGTFFINSLAHVFGRRRYETTDTSRNSFLLALITLGEGWHNNHHHYQSSANQGWFWWEIDLTYYSLKVLQWFGVVWDVRTPPAHAKYAHLEGAKGEKASKRPAPRKPAMQVREPTDRKSVV